MYNTERTVDECRIQKVSINMPATKTSKVSLNTKGDKRIYENNTKSYSDDEILYLFKSDLVNNINASSLDLDKDQPANIILELTINDDGKLIEAAIKLYNDLCI